MSGTGYMPIGKNAPECVETIKRATAGETVIQIAGELARQAEALTERAGQLLATICRIEDCQKGPSGPPTEQWPAYFGELRVSLNSIDMALSALNNILSRVEL